jgi:predicted nucleic acid-binding protein
MLVDTSAWVEFLRGSGSTVDRTLARLLDEGADLAVVGVVMQEVLQGCRDEKHASDVRRLLAACRKVEPVYPESYEHAAALYRRCRRAGHTVRGTVDCLIAAVAIEHGLALLAVDRDFEPLRRYAGLGLVRAE